MSNLNEYKNLEQEPESKGPKGEGDNNSENGGNNGNGPKKPNMQSALVFIMFTLVALLVMSFFTEQSHSVSTKETTYTAFLAELEAGNVKSVAYQQDRKEETNKSG